MTVKELIDELHNYSLDATVVIRNIELYKSTAEQSELNYNKIDYDYDKLYFDLK